MSASRVAVVRPVGWSHPIVLTIRSLNALRGNDPAARMSTSVDLDGRQRELRPMKFRELPPAARAVVCLVWLGGLVALGYGARQEMTLDWTRTAVVLALGAVFATRVVRVGARFHMSVSHPFVFAALLLDGVQAALMVAILNAFVAGLTAARRMRTYQIAFNLAAMATNTLVATLIWDAMRPALAFGSFEAEILPVLGASVGFYLANTGLVALTSALSTGGAFWTTWRTASLWAWPAFLAGSLLGLVMAHLVMRAGLLTLGATLPLCWLIYGSFRLYVSRNDEREERIRTVERLNFELEDKVRVRTDELVQVNERLLTSNAELGAANERLAELETMRGDLTHMLVHDLKSPLTAIQLGVQILAEAPEEAAGRTLGSIADATDRLRGMVQDILDVARLEEATIELDRAALPVRALLQEVIEHFESVAADDDHSIVLEVIGRPCVGADIRLIRRVIENLLSNAIKHTPRGGDVSVAAEQNDDGVVITVADRGPGVPVELREAVFDKFMSGAARQARGVSNHGLGLTFARLAVEAHGGRIWIEPRAGGGSRLRFTLPVHDEVLVAATVPARLTSG